MNIRGSRVLFIFIGVCIVCSACNVFSNENMKPAIGELNPLEVGNYWEYEVPFFSQTDTVRYEVTRRLQVQVDGESQTVFTYGRIPAAPAVPTHYWLYRNSDEGLILMGGIAETDTLLINRVEYRYPERVGAQWEAPQLSFSFNTRTFSEADVLEITLVDDARQITTPAGTFTCYVYNFKVDAGLDVSEDFDIFMFFAPTIGLVRQEERGTTDQRLISEMYLIDYRVE